MFEEYLGSNKTSRHVRAYMCLDGDNTPENYFFAPAIKRMGIVVAVRNNVSIKTATEEFIPPKIAFKGVFEIPYFYSYTTSSITSFAADLHPIGMYEITKKPGTFFKNNFVDGSAIWSKEEMEQLFMFLSNEDKTLQDRTRFFDDFLSLKIGSEVSEKSSIVERADAFAQKQNYQVALDEIAEELILSRKTLTRAFNEVLGVTPKQYFSSAIFEEIVRSYFINKETSMSDFLESPFYDFSHINKWFKKFTKMSPSEFISHDMDAIADVLSKSV